MSVRWYLKCHDCLSTVTIDVGQNEHFLYDARLECGICGGCLYVMGRVELERWIRTGLRPKCDGRCVSALGPNCDCECGGENHGKGLEGCYEHILESGTVRVTPPHKRDEALLRAEAYRQARRQLEDAFQRACPAYEAYRQGVRVPVEAYRRIRRYEERLADAVRRRSHKGRMQALAELIRDVEAVRM